MATHRQQLPQLNTPYLFVTDGGIETTLIFHDGLDLPHFAAFHLLQNPEGIDALRKYFRTYAALAAKHGVGLILESPTWRANPDWAQKLGYTPATLAHANRQAITLMEEIRREFAATAAPIVISGCVGPRGDGYIVDSAMSAADAQRYHAEQIKSFRDSAADMVTAITMNYVNEAIGFTRAARDAGLPCAVSFTVETDGRLPSGQTLQSAIEEVDAATTGYPSYYMLNCAHPTHFAGTLNSESLWTQRIKGLRANASTMSHAELNDATELDIGEPAQLAEQYGALKTRLPGLNVLGGCCGTDHRHVDAIMNACTPKFRTSDPSGRRVTTAITVAAVGLSGFVMTVLNQALHPMYWV